MKTKYLLLAGLLTIGTLGASGSTAAAPIDYSISDAKIAEIAQPAEMIDIQLNTMDCIECTDCIIAQHAIAGDINNKSLIAIAA